MLEYAHYPVPFMNYCIWLQEFSPWPMLDQTLMEVSSLLQLQKQAGWITVMLFLDLL
jgi:hypothetical protein